MSVSVFLMQRHHICQPYHGMMGNTDLSFTDAMLLNVAGKTLEAWHTSSVRSKSMGVLQ